MNMCSFEGKINKGTNEQKRWMNEIVNEWMNGIVNEWMNEIVNEWMNETVNELIYESVNEWMNEVVMNEFCLNSKLMNETVN